MKITLGWHKALRNDLDILAVTYAHIGVEVQRIESKTTDAVFHRDVMSWTPYGLVKCRMGKRSRRWEPDVWFTKMDLEPALVIEAPGTFEGADLLWMSNGLGVIGIGARTNWVGAMQLYHWLEMKGAVVAVVELPRDHDQHLLGVFNELGGQAFSYTSCYELFQYFDPTCLPDDERDQKGVNWVEFKEYAIVNRACIHAVVAATHFKTVIPLQIPQLLAHGGGIACATGIYHQTIGAPNGKIHPRLVC